MYFILNLYDNDVDITSHSTSQLGCQFLSKSSDLGNWF